MSAPTMGRVVLYRLDQDDVDAINRMRRHAPMGYPCADVHPGDEFMAWVVRVNPDGSVNLQVALDGPDTYWIAGVAENLIGETERGTWRWPPRV